MAVTAKAIDHRTPWIAPDSTTAAELAAAARARAALTCGACSELDLNVSLRLDGGIAKTKTLSSNARTARCEEHGR